MNDLLSKINITDFRRIIKQEIELGIDGEILLQKWAERKSSNPVMKELFKNDLILSFPLNNTELVIEKSYLEDMQLVFFQKYSQIILTEAYKNKDILFDILKRDIFLVGRVLTPSEFRELALELRYSTEFKLLSEALQLYVFMIIYIEKLIQSFIGTDSYDLKDFSMMRHYDLKIHKNEKLYRWFGRLIKKTLGKGSIEFVRYDGLLTRLSSFKDGILSQKNEMVLCLSIHPKDFFSVSKGNNWTSCFKYDGDYASSMSATLLSKDTVVAYVLKKSDYLAMKVSETWVPRKIWRSFVLINPLQMLIVKGYPNHSTNTFKKIHSELQKLLKIEYKSIDKIITKDMEMYEPEVIVEIGYNDIGVISEIDAYNSSSWFLNKPYLKNSDWHRYIDLSFQEMPMLLDTEMTFDFYTDRPSDYSNCLTLKELEDRVPCFDCGDLISYDCEEVFTNEYDNYDRCESCHDYFIERQEE